MTKGSKGGESFAKTSNISFWAIIDGFPQEKPSNELELFLLLLPKAELSRIKKNLSQHVLP